MGSDHTNEQACHSFESPWGNNDALTNQQKSWTKINRHKREKITETLPRIIRTNRYEHLCVWLKKQIGTKSLLVSLCMIKNYKRTFLLYDGHWIVSVPYAGITIDIGLD